MADIRTKRYFAQRYDDDEFDELYLNEYNRVLYGCDEYVNNTVIVYMPIDDTQIQMYDVHLENVCGSVIAGLCRLFKKLGMQTDFDV